jgi:hypothetical protein
VVCDDAVDDIEGQAGTLADTLRREERFEDAITDFGRDARAVVLHVGVLRRKTMR